MDDEGANGQALPPSTIAAQILRNGPPVASQQNRSVQREVFDKLLVEFLNDPFVDVGEDKLPDNARFVTFLLEAAAESRSTPDTWSEAGHDQAGDVGSARPRGAQSCELGVRRGNLAGRGP